MKPWNKIRWQAANARRAQSIERGFLAWWEAQEDKVKPKNLRMINLECCYTCQAMMADSDGWGCTLEDGPRWAEFDMAFRHVCDRYASRDTFHPYDTEGEIDMDTFMEGVRRIKALKDDLSQIPGIVVK
jgi:hypothetical protein